MKISSKAQKRLFIVLFCLFPLLDVLCLSYYPFATMLVNSFTDWNGAIIASDKNFIGLHNYYRIFVDPDIYNAFIHNFWYFGMGFIQAALGLILAILLNSILISTKIKNTFRASIFMPYIMNGVAVAYMFSFVFDYNGIINRVMKALGVFKLFGLEGISWLGNDKIVNFSLTLVAMWQSIGYLMVIFISSLQSISPEYYDAANIDGANSWQRFRYITLPSIKTTVELVLFLNLSGALGMFNLPYIITKGGPYDSSQTFLTRANLVAFQYHDFGLASAMGISLTIIIILLFVLQNKVFFRKEE